MNDYIGPRKRGKKQQYYKEQTNKIISQKKRICSIKKLVSENKLSKALAETEKYLDEYPEDSFGLFQQANILFLLDKLDEAKKSFQYIVDHNLESKYSSLYKLGMIAIQERDLDKAYEYFKTNIESSPYDEIFSIVELSKIELERGNIDEAYDILYRYTKVEDENILLQKASVFRIKGNYEEAYAIILENNFLNNPNILYDYYLTKGFIEIDLEKYDEAEESLNFVFSRRTKFYYKAATELAFLYYKKGNLEKSAEYCLDVINKSSSDKYIEKTMIILANIFRLCNRLDEAKKYCLNSVEYNCDGEQKGYLGASAICMLKKEYDEAISYVNKYLETAPSSKEKSQGYLKLALINIKQNDIKSATKNMKKIRSCDLDGINLDDYNSVKTHLRYVRNIPPRNDSYSLSQLYNYNLDSLIKHIDKVHIKENDKSKFSDKIDLEELVCQIPELLSNAQMIDNHYYETYRVKYPNIGYINKEEVNLLELIVFPETSKVLTMYPVKDELKNIKIPINEKQKIKHRSQIDKFNQKYGKG